MSDSCCHSSKPSNEPSNESSATSEGQQTPSSHESSTACCSSSSAKSSSSSCASSNSASLTSTSASASSQSSSSLDLGGCCGSSQSQAASGGKSGVNSGSCCDDGSGRPDYLFWGAFGIVALLYAAHLFQPSMTSAFGTMTHAVFELFNTMAIGMVIGILMVAILSKVPREFVVAILGSNTGLKGLLRATVAGLVLDLCSHGILMVGAKLYERGATTGQVMAFLIASPWNSLSLTIILVALIGLWWTLCFIVLSVVVAIVTGLIFDACVQRKILPANPHQTDLPDDFHLKSEIKREVKKIKFNRSTVWDFFITGLKESKMVIKWLFIGVILAALIRAFVPDDYFASFFGPSLLGLLVTIFAATVIEVCSEGSTPIAADIMNRAHAPGNGFAFLMTGVSTDYTEIMVLKDTTKSWKIALFLPLITVPQIVAMAFVLNSI